MATTNFLGFGTKILSLKGRIKFLEPNRPPISDLKKLRTYIGAGNEEAGCSSRQAAVTGQC